jgi:spermidine synthase
MKFESMAKILENKETEKFKLEKFEIKENSFFNRGVPKGEYIRLLDKEEMFNGVVMSDTPMEHRTNYEILNKAHGDVLIAGLGIGMILLPLMNKEEVKSITIVEMYQDIIDMVGSQLPLNDKVKIIQADIFNHDFSKGTKFDTIYFDIWNYVNSDVYEEMKELKKGYRKYLRSKKENPNSWIGCWAEYEAKNDKRLY